MPTRQEWQRALSFSRRLRVNSTQDLADRVNALPKSKSFTGRPKRAMGAPEFSPARRIQITPAELLFHVGRVTAPKIDNLADLCSTWARIRYLWAFSPDATVPNLCLSQPAMQIDFHQKGLLSDEIGVGMAALLMEKYFTATEPVDVSIAIGRGLVPGLRLRRRSSPDYIFRVGASDYAIVECKGSRSGEQAVLKQLKRGTEQVISLAFPGGYSPASYVIGTSLSQTSTTVYIIDPPDVDELPDKRSPNFIRDEAAFRDLIERLRLASLFRYVGASGRATELGVDLDKNIALFDDRARLEPPLRHRVDLVGAEYLGIQQSITLPGQSVRVSLFQGVAADVYSASIQRNEDLRVRTANQLYNRARGVSDQIHRNVELADERGAFVFDESATVFKATVFGRDGTLLEVEIS